MGTSRTCKFNELSLVQVVLAVKELTGADLTASDALSSSGLDSLGAVDFRKRMAEVTGLDLPSTLVYDYPSTALVTDMILEQLPAAPAPPSALAQTPRKGQQDEASGSTGTHPHTSGSVLLA